MTYTSIWQRVEEFRTEHTPLLNADKIPLDLLKFVELDLSLDLVRFDGLADEFSADAALLGDFSGFYIDGYIFDRIDTASHSQQNRLRFSLAHELGYYVLHKVRYESENIADFDSLKEWLNYHSGDKDEIERDANEFAGRLLVPIEVLEPLFEKLAVAFDALHGLHGWKNRQDLRKQTCEHLSQKFGLHPEGISTRLHREGLWPNIY